MTKASDPYLVVHIWLELKFLIALHGVFQNFLKWFNKVTVFPNKIIMQSKDHM